MERRNFTTLVFFDALVLAVFAGLVFLVTSDGPLTVADHFISFVAPSLWFPPLSNIMLFFTFLGSTTSIIIFSLFVIAYLFSKKRYSAAVFFAAAIFLSYLLTALLKNGLLIERPLASFVPEGGFSFPSGHATSSTAFFFSIWFIFFQNVSSSKIRKLLLFLCFLIPLLIGASRVYLNVHFASDILGGFLLGLFSSFFCYILWQWSIFLFKKRF
ncbi:MAG: hypothetical protein A2836_03880 [Candidatus Taylorbacteria bacterium RIFCSPHIGHO2_01_FULL_45_63]|uniref:Phosphatidic acid phosphatase type 2/haloperoxidase domain-containing protein n=1 Tax=Candidatus Taylorbacteria bacterium RIFCSPHIGHO2_02_FULL_45_35 TaxID=1802311 RepID=A0A1G2MS23_9BACT|nr:MAG: hypothetical protein A2836_03880 [Candidatus Taylorbacteria bacterium RIFCSPHIGHO2_01_FULL_45_63]OHA25802.1 MAG: hypothetical protein A3D56_00920 [Candidatus Taylorbacteria bacterium RIFCSPHIGHO2_02_FULL_45_35]OHA34365.1 MAG: hypothetical protein A3A22_00580 [Candidatus Taylorbacteria bacterium RIFCSPLOWO2_01_FULL_45_34b]